MAQKLKRLALVCSTLLAGCTIHHSKQALWTPAQATPSPEATFVTEEDSGLQLLGLFQLSEPDHYAVLLERARRRHNCARIHHAQLDFFTDHWIVVAFPISRMTLICEKGSNGPKGSGDGRTPVPTTSATPPPASPPPAAAPEPIPPEPIPPPPAPSPPSPPEPSDPAADADAGPPPPKSL